MPTCVHKIEFRNKLAERVKKNPVSFQPGVNLLIGPNGSGKSTICSSLAKNPKHPDVAFDVTPGKFRFFDFERDNPRVKSYVESDIDIYVRMMSHGEVIKELLKTLTQKGVQDEAVIIDEPEAAVDVDGIEQLIKSLRASPAHQVIVATHCPFLIWQSDFNIVELVDGYREHVKTRVEKLLTR